MQVTLAGSSFDTLLAVYTGTAVNALTLVAFNDNCSSRLTASCVTFGVKPGTTYYLQVDGVGGAKGTVSVVVTYQRPPANDKFSTAPAVIASTPATGTLVGATLEAGEPRAGPGASGSIWYKFSAPASGTAQVLSAKAHRSPSSGCLHCSTQY